MKEPFVILTGLSGSGKSAAIATRTTRAITKRMKGIAMAVPP